MRVILAMVSVISLLASLMLVVGAESAVHEILAACAFLICITSGAFSAVLDHLVELRSQAKVQIIALEQIARHMAPAAPARPAPPVEARPTVRIPGINA